MIRRLRVKNFKCFEDEEILFQPLTLLSGLNGMGKSTVIQSLLLLRQSYLQGLLQKKLIALNGDLTSLGTASNVLFEDSKEERIAFEIELVNKIQARWTFKYDREADVLEQISPRVSRQVFRDSLFLDQFHYLQAERIGPRTSFDMSDYQVRQHRQLGSRGEYAAHFLHQFGTSQSVLEKIKHPKAKSIDLRDQTEAWLSEISPGARIDVRPYSEMDLVNLQYSFEHGKQVSNPYRSTNTGFGITYALSVLVAVLSSDIDALVLLENPEAHLHPQGQVRVGRLIALAASCGVQIVVETHSDHLLNGIRLAVYDSELAPTDVSLNFFERRDYDNISRVVVTTPQIDKDGRIDHWPEGFFDEWEKSLDALLRTKDKWQ